MLTLPLSLPLVLRFWRSFGDPPEAPGIFWGAPGPPKTCPESCPGSPSGSTGLPATPGQGCQGSPGHPRAHPRAPQASPSRLGWPGLDWPGWLVGLAEAGVSSQVQRKIHNICWSGKAPRSHPPSASQVQKWLRGLARCLFSRFVLCRSTYRGD